MATQEMNVPEMAFACIKNAALEMQPAYGRVICAVQLLEYGPEKLANFGLGFCGLSVRHTRDDALLTVKAIESGTPLVGFVTSRTAMGSVQRFVEMLETGRVNWIRDKYPWI